MRGFYAIEHALVMDMLIRKMCMKEDELEILLKLERKQLRSVIAQLKNDKMLKFRLRMETGIDGKATRQNYYYINYRAFVNVVKYKLDHMMRKIETEERDLTSRASFVCTHCHKTYTDLEADQLFDMKSGEFRCGFCGEFVEEDMSVLPKADSRLVMAKFNEQIEPLYLLLKQVEDIILPNDILEPEPMDSSHIKSDVNATHSVIGGSGRGQINPKNVQYDSELLSGNSFSVKIEANANESIAGSEKERMQESVQEEGARAKKEQPAWLKGSTVFDDSSAAVVIKKEKENTAINFSTQVAEDSIGSSKEILDTLLLHEKAQESSKSALSFLHTNSYGLEESSDNFEGAATSLANGEEGEDEMMDTDEEEEDGNRPLVRVDGQDIALGEVTDEQIDKMSASEKEYYIKLTQEVYSHMYEIWGQVSSVRNCDAQKVERKLVRWICDGSFFFVQRRK